MIRYVISCNTMFSNINDRSCIYLNCHLITLCCFCAKELTEEGLPFVILFHNLDDKETPEIFRKQVVQELLAEKRTSLSL